MFFIGTQCSSFYHIVVSKMICAVLDVWLDRSCKLKLESFSMIKNETRKLMLNYAYLYQYKRRRNRRRDIKSEYVQVLYLRRRNTQFHPVAASSESLHRR